MRMSGTASAAARNTSQVRARPGHTAALIEAEEEAHIRLGWGQHVLSSTLGAGADNISVDSLHTMTVHLWEGTASSCCSPQTMPVACGS
jgi:hypothetical protein